MVEEEGRSLLKIFTRFPPLPDFIVPSIDEPGNHSSDTTMFRAVSPTRRNFFSLFFFFNSNFRSVG